MLEPSLDRTTKFVDLWSSHTASPLLALKSRPHRCKPELEFSVSVDSAVRRSVDVSNLHFLEAVGRHELCSKCFELTRFSIHQFLEYPPLKRGCIVLGKLF